MNKRCAQKGEVTIEATIIMVITMFMVFIMIGFGMIIYQQVVVINAAEEAATRVARLYAYGKVDSVTLESGKVVEDNVKERSGFGNLYRLGLQQPNESSAEDYLEELLDKTLLRPLEPPEADATVVADGLGKRHIEVRVTASFAVPLSHFFKLFGLPEEISLQATGTAECMDIIDYVNKVTYVSWFGEKISDVPVIKEVGEIVDAINSIFGLFV